MFGQENKMSCPYNQSHTFAKDKFLFHINKCKDKKKVGHLFANCQYNRFHIIPKIQIEFHQMTCPSREQALKIERNLRKTYNDALSEPRQRSREKQQHQFLKEQNNVKTQHYKEDTLQQCQQCQQLMNLLQQELNKPENKKIAKMIQRYYELGHSLV